MKHPLLPPKFIGTPLYSSVREFIEHPSYSNWSNVLTWPESILNNINEGMATPHVHTEGMHTGYYRDPEFKEWVLLVQVAVPLMDHDK